MKIEDLISRIAKYPGITRRSAAKLFFHLVKSKEKITDLKKILETIEDEIRICESCGNVAFQKLCEICINTGRDSKIVCIVEDFEDIPSLEKGMWYNGIYHVLGGLLSAKNSMMPENLNTVSLFEKIQKNEVSEIIFASNSSFEWQATMHFLISEMKKFEAFSSLKITEFARGLPIGFSFEYMDEGTLQIAFKSRTGIL